MYTWGCGWHGQTGHDTWQNTYEPRLLKVTESKDSKFIQASCGTKHTIALDTNGYIWFFGLKTSVGKTCNKTEEKQLTPIELEIPDSIQKEPFKFIASGDD